MQTRLHVALTVALATGAAPIVWEPAHRSVVATAASSQGGRVVDVHPGHDIQALLDAHPAGTRFVLAAGTYRLSTPLVPRTAQSLVAGGRAVLSGARRLTGFSRTGSYWVVGGQTQQGAVIEDAAVFCAASAPRCLMPEDVFVDDVMLRHVPSVAALEAGTWHFDYDRDRIVLFDDPSGHVVETSVTPAAILGNASGVTLRGLIVEKFATPTHEAAVDGEMHGLTLEDCELRLNHFAGARTVRGSRVRRNRAHHNGALGLMGAGEDILVEQNQIDHNGIAGYNPHWTAGGTKWVYTTRLIVRDNDAHDNHGPGLWADINNTDVLFEGNRVSNNDLSGIFHEVGYRAIIRNNTATRNGRVRPYPGWVVGAGIQVSSSSDVEVYGNVLVDNWQGITAVEAEREGGNQGPWVLDRLHVHDNVVRYTVAPAPGSGRTGVAQENDGTSAFAPGRQRFVNNVYYLVGHAPPFFWGGRDVGDDEWRRRYQHDLSGRVIR